MPPTFQLQGTPIFVRPLLDSFSQWLENQDYSRFFLITDDHCATHCLPCFFEKNGLQKETVIMRIPPGETAKNLETCKDIWSQMLDSRLDRKALVINLGGGVIGDMGGFCAAVWKRGVDFVQIPTTLLAMTDAAIGGKTGIDFQGVKNALGVFCQPAAVFIDPSFLTTLPEREMRSGMAEIIKHAVVGDPEQAGILPESLDVTDDNADTWRSLLQRSIAVKVRVVEEDPMETHRRKLLNFGHTIGHALESFFLETADPLTHGEAVYIGMCCEAQFFKGKRPLLQEIRAMGQRFFSKCPLDPAIYPALWALMQQDKKNSSGMVTMAIPDETPFSLQLVSPTYHEVVHSLNVYTNLD